jgi:hypothetical protein
MRRFLILVTVSAALLLQSCSSSREAWRAVNTRDLDCHTFEVIVARGLSFTAKRLQGVVLFGYEDPHEPLDGVAITLRALGGGAVLDWTVSNAAGEFAFPPMADGWYQVETCREGWNSVVVPVRVSHHAGTARVILHVTLAN